jgi:hypothetical protein
VVALKKRGNVLQTISPHEEFEKYSVVNISLFREYVYMLMTGENKELQPNVYNQLMDDFELMCMFRFNDFLSGEGFVYGKVSSYKEFFKKQAYLTKGELINYTNLADFLDKAGINQKTSEDTARQKFELIYWCYIYYTKGCPDFLITHPNKTKGSVTISEFLRNNPGFVPYFMAPGFETSPINYFEREIFSKRTKVPKKIISEFGQYKGKPKFDNVKEIMQTAKEVFKLLDQKTQDELKTQPPYIITDNSSEIARYHEQSFEQKDASDIVFVSSFWSFPVKFNITKENNTITFDTQLRVTLDDAKGIIGKYVLIRWPNVEKGKVGKIVIDNIMIDENKKQRKLSPNYLKYVRRDISGETNTFVYVKPYESHSMSSRIFKLRSLYKIVPLNQIIPISDDHPILQNYKPMAFESSELQDNDSVFIPSMRLHGIVKAVDGDRAIVQYEGKKTNCILTYEKDYGNISKKDLVGPELFESIEEINYFIEKLGFSDSMFNSGSDKIPACLKTYILSAKTGEGSSPVYTLKKQTKQTHKEKEFKINDLIYRGSDLSSLKRNGIQFGSRVVFIGKTTSIPFGTVGTVCRILENTPSVEVIADTEIDYGVKRDGQSVLFKTRIGDLLNIDAFE